MADSVTMREPSLLPPVGSVWPSAGSETTDSARSSASPHTAHNHAYSWPPQTPTADSKILLPNPIMALPSSQIQLLEVMRSNFWMLYLILLRNPQYNSLFRSHGPTGPPYSRTAPSKTNCQRAVRKTGEQQQQPWEGPSPEPRRLKPGQPAWSHDHGGVRFQSTLRLSDYTRRATAHPACRSFREIRTR